ncbi:MAG: folate-binding protein YgfZ [Gammaproteobacteria bacterium]|nr:folate-binding protein YgfZ [Gammaproteobacteria bacterium]
MNSQWEKYLESTYSGQPIQGVSNEWRPPSCALMDLSHLGLIQVTGEDADTFLQGQVTNDIRELGDENFQINSYCSPKGRMLAIFHAFRHAGALTLQMSTETQSGILERLRKFILMAKVRIDDASDLIVKVGLAGTGAESLLQQHFTALPDQPGKLQHENGVTVMRLPADRPRFELLGSTEKMIDLWGAFLPAATVCHPDYWSLLDIRAGTPNLYNDTAELFVPQMTNLQLIDGVSFTKGCYTGQEVVARMKYLGKLKRRMYLTRIQAGIDFCPKPGDELYSSTSASGQGAGKIVDARPSPDGGCELLAVLEIAAFEQDDVHIGSTSGPKLQLMSLPYEFESH